MKSYNEKQLRAGNLLEEVTLSGESIPADIIEQIVALVGEPGAESGLPATQEASDIIKLRMLDEPDWRKKAAMAALLISRSLE